VDISGQLHMTATFPLDLESSPDTHQVQDLVGHRASLDTVEERKTMPLLGTNSDSKGRPVIISNELSQFLVNKSGI